MKIGAIVEVTFYDHDFKARGARSLRDETRFRAYGVLSKQTKNFLTITSWKLVSRDKDLLHNEEKFRIHKGTIIKMRELK